MTDKFHEIKELPSDVGSVWVIFCAEVLEGEYQELLNGFLSEKIKKNSPLWFSLIEYLIDRWSWGYTKEQKKEIYLSFKELLDNNVSNIKLQHELDGGRVQFELDESFPIRDFYIAVFNELFPSGYFK